MSGPLPALPFKLPSSQIFMREGSVDSKAYCIRRILEAISDSKVNFAVRTMKPNNCRSKNVKKNARLVERDILNKVPPS